MSNENQELQQTVLIELLQVQKESDQNMKSQEKQLQKVGKELQDLRKYISGIQINIPVKEFVEKLQEGMQTIHEAISRQPKEVLHENRILLYPKGQGQAFWSLIIRRIFVFMLTGLLGYWGIKYGFRYLRATQENTKYKYAWYWMYLQQKPGLQETLNEVLEGFNEKDVYAERREVVDRYLEEIALAEEIRRQERALDSLRRIQSSRQGGTHK